MVTALTLGCLLGIFSGMVPGPFTALITATALSGGFWAGFRLGIVPLVTETLVLTVTALALSQLPEETLRWMGLTGGLFIFYLAWRTWQEAGSPPEAEPLTGGLRQTAEGAVLSVLSPTPWVFWLLVGGPLFLGAWHDGWGTGLAFYGSFLTCLIGVYLGIAGLASYGQKRLSDTWQNRIMHGTAGALVVAGIVLIWQSHVGNFQRMVTGSETIESIVNESRH
jgi:threonine/homoserine/homoserine lactone efflux protein